jgi:hypothetical protein
MAARRQILLRGALVVAVVAGARLLATGTESPERAGVVIARAGPAQPSERLSAPREPLPLELPRRPHLAPVVRDLFPGAAPPPPAPAARAEPEAVPAPPAAPALPFTFVGSFESEGGHIVYYLAEAEKLHLVRTGETLNGAYRVESAAPDRLELIYLPLAVRQTLAFGNKR